MKKLIYLLTLTAFVVVSACGDSGAKAATSGGATPTTVAVAGATASTTGGTGGSGSSAAPQRIVSLSATATETLFAIGAGKQVVAVDDQSNYPPEAPKTDLSGYTPNIEAIAAKKPDLVVISTDTEGLKAKLEGLKITTLLQPAAVTLDDAYAEITALGKATGHDKEAATTVATMKASIDTSIKKVTKPAVAVKMYHELDNTLYSVSSKSFIGAMYKLVGLENIADAADKSGSGYPQLTAEYVIAQSPNMIFLADTKCCGQNAATVSARAGWNTVSAVKSGAVIELDDDIASRWGPRTPLLLDQIATAVAKIVHS